MDINILITAALKNTSNAYVIRDAGSFVAGHTRDKADEAGGEAIKAFLAGLDWQEVTSGVRADGMGFGQCRYVVASVPDNVDAWECIAEWRALTPEQKEAVEVRRSPHASSVTGYMNELISKEIKPAMTTQVVMALGNGSAPMDDATEETAAVFFWAPGRWTKFCVITDNMAEDRGLIPDYATVKLEG
jgi:hypothetical protein